MDDVFLRQLLGAAIEAGVILVLAAICAGAIRLALEFGRGLAFRRGWPGSLVIAVLGSFLLSELWSNLAQAAPYAASTLGVCAAVAVLTMIVQVRGRRP